MKVFSVRSLLPCLVAALSLTRADAGAPEFNLHGTAHAGGRSLPNAIVWLEAPNPPGSASGKVVLDQRNLSFSPHVLAVRMGTTVEFPNNDRVFHNVFSFRDGKRFDLGMYPVGMIRNVKFDQPGLSRIFCNIHPNMAAYVMTVDSSYFAVADETGRFLIASVPPGSYTYRPWCPGGTALTASTTIDGDKPLEIRWP